LPVAKPRHLPAEDDNRLPLRQKLMVHSSEHARHAGRPLRYRIRTDGTGVSANAAVGYQYRAAAG
jgi:hypothetical protein